MKNLHIYSSGIELQQTTYCISRFSHAYSFFNSEFHGLSRDLEGNIILPLHMVEEKKEKDNKKQSIKQFLKDHFTDHAEAFAVPMSSEEYQFFASEYRLSEDTKHNIIVPLEEHPNSRRR